ncbi:MAG TPA: hypothetical protein V6D47_08605 [Oscillatoriaceae cyanobacterium]
MLKINHPGAIVREREKKLNNWENVKTTRYANGVELQILVGYLPHGNLQSAISANRPLTLSKEGQDLVVAFGDAAAPLLDFTTGDRLTSETPSAVVLDACGFVPTAKVAVKKDGQEAKLNEENGNLVAKFDDGTEVSLHPHGGHAHVEAKQGEKNVKTFYNGKDNTLYVFGETL